MTFAPKKALEIPQLRKKNNAELIEKLKAKKSLQKALLKLAIKVKLISKVYKQKKEMQNCISFAFVGPIGFEPMTPCL